MAPRGEALLLAHLDERQRKEYRATGCFIVRGRSGRRYVINTGAFYSNVFTLDRRGVVDKELCAYVPDVTRHDNGLAQKLMLQHNDRRFRKVAIASTVHLWSTPASVRACIALHGRQPVARDPRLTPPWRWRCRWKAFSQTISKG